jgi:SAM-dependent methyltransferase
MVPQADKLAYRDADIYAGLARNREFPGLARLLVDNGVSRVLDVGCGDGRHLAYLATRGIGGAGVEVSPSLASRARDASPDADIIEGDALQVDLGSGYDAALCLGSTLQYWTQNEGLDAILGRMYESLAPRGLLVLDLNNFGELLEARIFRRVSVKTHSVQGRQLKENLELQIDVLNQTVLAQWQWHLESEAAPLRERTAYRILLPQETRKFLETAGYMDVEFPDFEFEAGLREIDGSRLVVTARRP